MAGNLDTTSLVNTLQALAQILATNRQLFIAALEQIGDGNSTTPQVVFVEDVNRFYRLNASDTTSADNGNTVVVDAAGRRWYGEANGGPAPWTVTTTDGTPTLVTFNGATASLSNLYNIASNTAYAVRIVVVARNTAAQDVQTWVMDGCILSRGVALGTTTFVASMSTAIVSLGTTVGWNVTVTADTTFGGLDIVVTGVAATTIHWAVTISSTNVS